MERSFAGKVMAAACLSLLWVTQQAQAQSCSAGFGEIEIKHACQNAECSETASRMAPVSDTLTRYDHLENDGVRADYSNAYDGLLKKYVVTVRDVCQGPRLNGSNLTCSKGIADMVRTVADLRTVTSDIFLMTNT